MSYYLIGIGGSGARCVESFVHLNGAGLLKDADNVYAMFVDPDTNCGNLKRADEGTLGKYAKAFDAAGIASKSQFLQNKIERLGHWNPVPVVESGEPTLDAALNRSTLKGTPYAMLYDALFSNQERTTSLTEGFRGHPVIGATTIAQKMNHEVTDDAMTKLFHILDGDADPRVFLFASVFGGTGASGFPNIARFIKDHCDSRAKDKVKIGGCLLLPYFNLPQADPKAKNEMQAKSELFLANTYAALDYYNSNHILGDIFNEIYLLGDRDANSTIPKVFSLGSSDQENDAHFIELFAALGAIDFFNKAPEEFKKPRTPMMALNDRVISWKDFPEASSEKILSKKFQSYIRFLYAYRTVIMPDLTKIAADKSKSFLGVFGGIEKKYPWYKHFVKEQGKLDIKANSNDWERFDLVRQYADCFFSWLTTIAAHPRCQELVHESLYDEVTNIKEQPLPVDEIIFNKDGAVVAAKDKLNRVALTNRLSATKIKDDYVNAGAGPLLQALYDVCELK